MFFIGNSQLEKMLLLSYLCARPLWWASGPFSYLNYEEIITLDVVDEKICRCESSSMNRSINHTYTLTHTFTHTRIGGILKVANILMKLTKSLGWKDLEGPLNPYVLIRRTYNVYSSLQFIKHLQNHHLFESSQRQYQEGNITITSQMRT